ncbi:hypothetical protein Gotur_001356 [Gossypium turneri]
MRLFLILSSIFSVKKERFHLHFEFSRTWRKKDDTTSILDDMLQMGINPNISTFRMLIEAFCKASDFGVAKELFEIGLYVVTKSLHIVSSTLTHKQMNPDISLSLLVVGGVFFPGEMGKEESGKAGVEERMRFSAEFGCQI